MFQPKWWVGGGLEKTFVGGLTHFALFTHKVFHMNKRADITMEIETLQNLFNSNCDAE